jgi:hypothetical protein
MLIILLPVFGGNFAFGQDVESDSTKCKKAIDNAISMYNNMTGIQSGIYTGYDYPYERLSSGHVFFESDNLVNGSIVYDHVEYQDVPMLYDIVKDNLVIQGTYQPYFILLESDKVSRFSVSGQNFIRILSDDIPGSVIKTGFYKILYDGEIKAFVKKNKIIDEFVDIGNVFKTTVVEKDKWYIYKEGKYFEIQGKSSVLNVLDDKKKEILQLCKQDKIRFKNNMDEALTRIVAYYDN